jgi:hypothetical protein
MGLSTGPQDEKRIVSVVSAESGEVFGFLEFLLRAAKKTDTA